MPINKNLELNELDRLLFLKKITKNFFLSLTRMITIYYNYLPVEFLSARDINNRFFNIISPSIRHALQPSQHLIVQIWLTLDRYTKDGF